MKDPTPKTLGVIACKEQGTPPFQETVYLKQLTREGRAMGIRLIVFSPKDIDWRRRTVSAWFWDLNSGKWGNRSQAIPPLVYDRCYYRDSRHYRTYKPYVTQLAQDSDVQLLGRPLGGKLQTQEMLEKNAAIRPYLPRTLLYRSPEDLKSALNLSGSILIKPNGGSHGRGVAAIFAEPGRSYRVQGRTRNNRGFHIRLKTERALRDWILRFTGSARYLIQPYLGLQTEDGRPFDLRILVQKGEDHRWVTTGMAVRTGKTHSLTSNIHGGGKAERAIPFLTAHFPGRRLSGILRSIRWLAEQVPRQIEKEHGRLAELGLDIGIDRQGRVWLLEVNSKPGRTVFLLTRETDVRRRSIQLPMQYARTLLNGLVGGSV
ncbi:YheC/YheD family endospore coat-associated protein [Paludifilum halophilum]|nr:YheC/YheD family protein [Paludifilum halophilum]